MTMTFLRKKRTRNYGVPLEMSLGASRGAGVAEAAEFPYDLEKDPTTLFQKISKRPSTLASPDVTVITWSGPP